MTIYLDKEYCCHTQPAEDLRAAECDWADGKCRTYIESYRYIPQGETWTRADGEIFCGVMLTPQNNAVSPETAQSAYEDALTVLRPQLDNLQLAVAESYETTQDDLTALRLALAEIYESMEV